MSQPPRPLSPGKDPEKVAAEGAGRRGALRQPAGKKRPADREADGEIRAGTKSGRAVAMRAAGRRSSKEPGAHVLEREPPEPSFGRFLFFLVGAKRRNKKSFTRRLRIGRFEFRDPKPHRSSEAGKNLQRKAARKEGGVVGEAGRVESRGFCCPRGNFDLHAPSPCALQDRIVRVSKDDSE